MPTRDTRGWSSTYQKAFGPERMVQTSSFTPTPEVDRQSKLSTMENVINRPEYSDLDTGQPQAKERPGMLSSGWESVWGAGTNFIRGIRDWWRGSQPATTTTQSGQRYSMPSNINQADIGPLKEIMGTPSVSEQVEAMKRRQQPTE